MPFEIRHKCYVQPCPVCALISKGAAPRPNVVRKSLPVRGLCHHLGKRTEFRDGCGGSMCRHECDAGEPVAVPGGVCQTCPKWEPQNATAAATDPNRPQWRPVSPPAVTSTKPRLVITVAVGDEGQRTHALTRASQQRYAEQVGADYVVLSDQTQDWFMLEKFRYRDWVRYYPGGTVCIDADIWVSRSAPDLFALVPPDKIGVSIADDLHTFGLMPEFNRKLAEVCESQGVPIPAGADQTHWNSGLVVLRPEHADYWSPPTKPIPKHWVAEELWSKVNTFRRGWELFELPHPASHWQYWRDQKWEHLGPPLPSFVHPAGMTQQPNGLQRRLDLFRVLEASDR